MNKVNYYLHPMNEEYVLTPKKLLYKLVNDYTCEDLAIQVTELLRNSDGICEKEEMDELKEQLL